MRNKGKLLALVTLLVVMLAVAASAGAIEYTYRLPDGYDANKDISYPVVYILPQSGYGKDDSAIYDKFKDAMADGTGMSMILIKPELTKGMDLHKELKELVEKVDASYKTIADPAHRTLIGTGAGGYLAYAVGMTESAGKFTEDSLFGNIASINGNFVDNPWYSTYGDVHKLLKDAGSAKVGKYYTYMDAPVDGTWTNMTGSSNDIGNSLIGFGLAANVFEYTVRPGIYDNAFVTESVNRVADRLTQNMIGNIVSGNVSLVKGVLTASDKKINADYSVKISKALSTFVGSDADVKVTVSVVDPDGKVVVSGNKKHTVSADSSATGSLEMSNKATQTSTVTLTAEILGAKIDLATANLIIGQEPTNEVIDLLGDWYFKYTGRSASSVLDMAALSSTDDSYKSWHVVQPGLAWWTKGFGNIDDTTVSCPWPSYFDMFIIGNAYYVREFEIPANFKMDGAVLSMGYVDDRCEVYVNGKRVGGTGIDENGNSTGESSWEKYTYIPVVDSSMFNIGGKNTIVVRDINDGVGGGGWYAGPMGFYSAEAFEEINPEAYNPRFYESTFPSNYAAKMLGEKAPYDNPYLIYLPEGYYETERYYPTVYLMHQYNSTHTSYKTDDIDRLLDEAIADGMFDEMIVVVPNSQESSWWRGDWMKMVSEELVPYIDANYRTIKDARYRFTAGCSMGGQGAFGVALQNPNLFSGAISFFGAFSMGGDASPNYIAEKESAKYMDYFSMYFICGNQDVYKFGQPAIELNQQLDKMGVNHFFLIENGAHDSSFYVPYFKSAFKYTWDDMYDTDDDIVVSRLVYADAYLEGDSVKLYVAADKSINKYFNDVPASSYTNDQTPALNVPVTVTLKDKTTGAYYRYTVRDNDFARFDSKFSINTHVVKLSDFVKVSSKSSPDITTAEAASAASLNAANLEIVEVRGSLFDDTATKSNKEITVLHNIPSSWPLPETGDNSNIALFAALLLISVAGIAFLGKKKASC